MARRRQESVERASTWSWEPQRSVPRRRSRRHDDYGDFDDDFEEDWEDDLTEDDEFPDTFGGADEPDEIEETVEEESPFADDPDFDDA